MIIRSLIATICFILLLVTIGVEGRELEGRALTIADIPACGMKCLFLNIPKAHCQLNDIACICEEHDLLQSVGTCMVSNCTMDENLETARVNKALCNLSQESKSREVITCSVVVYAFAFVCVVLRLAGKYVSNKVAWNDVPVVGSILLAAAPIGLVIAMSVLGFGEHLWNLEDDRLATILLYFYICRSVYILILGLIKISLVLFYLEIFTTRRFRRLSLVLFAYIVMNSLMIFLMTVFACTPVQAFWNRDLLLGSGKCMDIQIVSYVNSVSSIVQDMMLMALPMFFIKDLQMARHRKLALVSMFTLGGFGCIATIIRLHTLLKFKITFDPTWDYVSIVVWTELEITACFLCVSLPSIRVLVMKLAPLISSECRNGISHLSKHKSNKDPTSRPAESPPPGQWNKPVSWTTITTGEKFDFKKHRKSNSVNSRTPIIPRSQFSVIHSTPRRLESATSNYSDATLAVGTHHEPTNIKIPASRYAAKDTKRFVRRASRNTWGGYEGGDITALPSIGCLPERTYSKEHLDNKP